MKTLKKIVALSLLVVSPLVMAQEQDAVMMQKLRGMYPATNFKSVRLSQFPGIYEVIMGQNIAYVDGSGRYFLFGHVFDMPAQRDLSQERLEQETAVNFETLPLADAVKVVRGSGKRRMAVFSDPDCPYCRQLERSLGSLTDVTIYTFLMPLAQLHPDAPRKATSVWCSENRGRAWLDLMNDGAALPDRSCDAPIDRNLRLAETLAISGTPTIIFEDGRKVPGALGVDAMEAALQRASGSAK